MIANGDPIDGMDANGTITNVVVDNPGSGYSRHPGSRFATARSSTRSTGPPRPPPRPTSSWSASPWPTPAPATRASPTVDGDRPDRDRLGGGCHGGHRRGLDQCDHRGRPRRRVSVPGHQEVPGRAPAHLQPGHRRHRLPVRAGHPGDGAEREVHPHWAFPRPRPTTARRPTSTSSAWCSTAPSSPPTCRRPWSVATSSCPPRGSGTAGAALQRAARRHPAADRRLHRLSPRRSGSARSSPRPRTSRCGSCSATCCPPAPTVTCSCPPTAP